LFSEAGITWKRSQKVNPKAEPEVVKKQEEIREFIGVNQSEIESERLV
jgi:putative transposase